MLLSLTHFFLKFQFFFIDEEEDGRKMEELEELIWKPENCLADRQIDQFLIIAR